MTSQAPWLDERPSSNGKTVQENFREWFGESKVVDTMNFPMTCFHGTKVDFLEFSSSMIGTGADRKHGGGDFGQGFYFTSSNKRASLYSKNATGANVIPVFLSIKRPAEIEDLIGIPGWQEAMDNGCHREATDLAEASGFDGVIVRDEESLEWVVFKPDQIKSAIGNCGLYLPNSASLTDHSAQFALLQAERAKSSISAMVDVFRPMAPS